MANAILSPKVYANAFVHLLTNELVIAKKVSNEFKDEFKKRGSTVYAKRVPEFTVRDGAVAAVQDVVEGEVAVTIDKQKGIDVEFTSVEDTLSVDALLKSWWIKINFMKLEHVKNRATYLSSKRSYRFNQK